jgi:DNA-binding beta-propeller fold protein YncE
MQKILLYVTMSFAILGLGFLTGVPTNGKEDESLNAQVAVPSKISVSPVYHSNTGKVTSIKILLRQIAVDRNIQFLYVVDSENHRVQVFDSNGKNIKQWGGKGNGDGRFNLPISIVMDNNGNLIVNDRGTGRIQKFDRDGNFILKFGSIGKGPAQLGIAEHMAVDKYNNIYVNNAASEAGVDSQAKIMKFSPTGKFITKWGDKGEFMDPEHLAIDSEGNVYVSDRGNNNIQVFKPVIE